MLLAGTTRAAAPRAAPLLAASRRQPHPSHNPVVPRRPLPCPALSTMPRSSACHMRPGLPLQNCSLLPGPLSTSQLSNAGVLVQLHLALCRMGVWHLTVCLRGMAQARLLGPVVQHSGRPAFDCICSNGELGCVPAGVAAMPPVLSLCLSLRVHSSGLLRTSMQGMPALGDRQAAQSRGATSGRGCLPPLLLGVLVRCGSRVPQVLPVPLLLLLLLSVLAGCCCPVMLLLPAQLLQHLLLLLLQRLQGLQLQAGSPSLLRLSVSGGARLACAQGGIRSRGGPK